MALLVLTLLAGACAPLQIDAPTPRPSPLATRIVRTTPTPERTPTAAATNTPGPVRRFFVDGDFDPYAALYVSEREGIYVTTRNPRGRYYYKWDDRRWMALTNRVWFRTLEDLLTVFPSRVAAP